ncbi:MAG: T9SS type A sorting domain-containing protein [Ignavibacteriae bacterium]|nr:T9SS type A sorting domain-containing protein [Ignavibacteriota bacterium]
MNYEYISKTTNYGLNWIKKAFPNISEIRSIYFINKNTGFLGSDYSPYSSSIKRTTNGGDNWVDLNEVAHGINSFHFLDSNVGYAAGDLGVILKTTNGGAVWVSNNTQEIPKSFELFQNYPNPFNPTTNIKYQITNSKLVTLRVYDILGKEIATLVNEKKTAGIYEVTFNGSNFASGVYFYRIQAGDFVQVKKMVLIK